MISDGIVRSFLTIDPHVGTHVNVFDIDTKSGGTRGHAPDEYLPRAREQSMEDDASLADLSPFQEHGGKLLLVHGVQDSTISTASSVLLFTRILGVMGQERTDTFVRLYLIPGFEHGQGVFNAGFDTVGVLDRWVDG